MYAFKKNDSSEIYNLLEVRGLEIILADLEAEAKVIQLEFELGEVEASLQKQILEVNELIEDIYAKFIEYRKAEDLTKLIVLSDIEICVNELKNQISKIREKSVNDYNILYC
ncbi:MAG: hypothetical protein CME70_10375 [Halobacteriovorax sp.]|nr:hypothetical protein [Halobacteriovorax sp.]|tara:strand:+ start:141326 stop:141661 length:336 start_codon:yes stop_codon:yes gene_type:complete